MAQVQKAVVINRLGGVDVLEVVHDHPIPERKSGEVLVKLRSTSVNPVDTAIRAGSFPLSADFPVVLGGDVAGVVIEADATAKVKPGDSVFALTNGFRGDVQEGSYAQFVSIPEDWLAHVPPNLPLEQAGGVPLVALTAWQAIDQAKPKPGQRLLVYAGAGGVGHFVVQLGKALGLHVTATTGPANAAFVKEELGADEVLNYAEQDVAAAFSDKPFDIVVDALPNNIRKSLEVLKPDGVYSHIFNFGSDRELLKQLAEEHAAGRGPTVVTTFVTPNGQQLEQVSKLIADGKVKLVVAETFPLEQVGEAHQQVETGHTRGKVVVTVD